MKKKNNNLTPFVFLLVFIILCMILVNIQGAKVNEITIDEFTKYLNNNEITELEIITKVRSENYEVTGKIKDYKEKINVFAETKKFVDIEIGDIFKNGDVLFARITPCMENGKAAIVTDLKENTIAFGSTEFIVLRGKYQKLTSILAILVRDEEFRTFAKTQMKGTDGRQRVDAISLLDYEMLIPEDKILRKIESDLSKLHYQMYLITKENFKLTELQSLLLAKMGQ